MDKKMILVLIIGIFLITLVSAQDPSFIFKQSTPASLGVPLYDQNYVQLTSCTAYLTVTNPDGSILLQNALMTCSGGFANYTLNRTQTDNLGVYGATITFNNSAASGFTTLTYQVTANGEATTIAQSTIYLVLFVFLIGIFIFLTFAFLRIETQNSRDEEGRLVAINYKKYLKIFVFMMGYVCLIGIAYFSWNLAYGILHFTEMANFFYFIFRTLFIGLFLIVPLAAIITIIKFVKDKKVENLIKRGISVNG